MTYQEIGDGIFVKSKWFFLFCFLSRLIFSQNPKKTSFNRKMAFEAKMIYVLAENECNYTLKHVSNNKIS